YIAELAGSVPTAANAGYYAKIVAQKATVRRLIKTATEITQKAYTENDDVTTLLDDAERDIMNVSEQRNQSGFKSISDVLNASIEEIDRLYQNDDD
ncbi:replicative DNA helicase, partial [Lactiplantibacillus plantarum]